ncbi:hypothetical protein ACTWPB_14055 [Nocardia sp. IBHARD005]|uniref:hypothetical protein n=1 Tax=Nocardia sp. IBHARD005 TaxID=3457765 RepID=UPI00405977B2
MLPSSTSQRATRCTHPYRSPLGIAMSESVEGRFEQIAQKARQATDRIAQIRGTAYVAGVRIEVDADGRITALESNDPAITQAVRFAHAQAMQSAQELAADIRRELADDPILASAMRKLVDPTPVVPDQQPRPSPTVNQPVEPQHWQQPSHQRQEATQQPQSTRYHRDRVVGPTSDDDTDPYYQRKSWLV